MTPLRAFLFRLHDRSQWACDTLAGLITRYLRHSTAVYTAAIFVYWFFFAENDVAGDFDENPSSYVTLLLVAVVQSLFGGFVWVGIMLALRFVLRNVVPRGIVVVVVGLPVALLLIAVKALLS